jgi:hypothetical protein
VRWLLVVPLLLPGTASGQILSSHASAPALMDALESAWGGRDADAYLALWSFPGEEARAAERDFARMAFDTGAGGLLLERPQLPPAASQLRVSGRFVAIQEPRGRVEQHVFRLEARDGAWFIAGRENVGRIDGLVHLSLDPQGYRADGLSIRLEDFELRMERGTLFMAPEQLGPTVGVFVGEASVILQPTPETEREQLRQFIGRPELRERVKAAYVRIHPADLSRVLQPMRLERDPQATQRLSAAQAYFDEQAPRAFVLDASLPGAPWWVMPGLGDSLVSFDLPKRGTMTFTINMDQAESISLFNRTRRQQVCLYPSRGRGLRYSEEEGRDMDILHHDLRLRFDPMTQAVEGEDELRLRLLRPVTTLRLKLDDALRVESVTSAEAGRHLFFRVRHQDTLMVSLGSLAGQSDEVRLRVRYGGRLSATPVESELLQLPPIATPFADEGPPIESVDVYSNRSAFYPQATSEDYATSSLRIDVPAGLSALSGGERVSARSEGGRTVVEFRQTQPGKYITVAVARFQPVGQRALGTLTLSAYGLSRTRNEAQRSLDQAEDMLRFFNELFGPCPYDRINLAAIEARLPGGHSPPGMVVVARRSPFVNRALRDDPTNFSDVPGFFLAHELAHQWWGHGVAPQNYRERWLSEGFAQYAAALWVRRSQGEEAFQGVLRRLARWAVRMSPWGPISLGYRLGHVKNEPNAFRALAYDKAAYVLHMLDALLGPETFRRALVDFQVRFRYARAGSDDLREALEAASGQPLGPFFEYWIHGTAIPSLAVSHSVERVAAGHRTLVRVDARDLESPLALDVTVFHEGGRVSRRVILPPGGGSFPVDSPKPAIRVEVNADRGALAKLEGG